MYRNHREAFAPKKGSKRPVEANLDNIINQAQIKMKEMILEKQEIDKQTNTLIGQENVLNENINFLKSEISNKKQTIASLNEKVKETNEGIKKLEIENKKVIKEANIQEAKLKDDINGEVVDLKDANNKLRERLYLLSRRLYTLEVRNLFFYFKIFLNFRWNIMML